MIGIALKRVQTLVLIATRCSGEEEGEKEEEEDHRGKMVVVMKEADSKASDVQTSAAGTESQCRASAAERSRPNATASGPLVLHARTAADHALIYNRASPGLGAYPKLWL